MDVAYYLFILYAINSTPLNAVIGPVTLPACQQAAADIKAAVTKTHPTSANTFTWTCEGTPL